MCGIVDEIDNVTQNGVPQTFSMVAIDLCRGVISIVALRDRKHSPRAFTTSLTRPYDLAKLQPREFYALLKNQEERLLAILSSEQ